MINCLLCDQPAAYRVFSSGILVGPACGRCVAILRADLPMTQVEEIQKPCEHQYAQRWVCRACGRVAKDGDDIGEHNHANH